MLRLMGNPPAQLLRRSHDENIAELVRAASGSQRERLKELIGDRRHLIVDEFQDLPGVRGDLVLALLKLLAPPSEHGFGFTILGDPAQAIFGFAAGIRDDGSSYPSLKEYWQSVVSLYGAKLEIRILRKNYRATSKLARLSADLRRALLDDRPDEAKLQTISEALAALPKAPIKLSPEFLDASSDKSRAVLTRTNGEALQVFRELVGYDEAAPAVKIHLHAGGHALLPPAWIAAFLQQLRAQQLVRTQFSKIYEILVKKWGSHGCKLLGVPTEDTAWERLAVASGAPSDTTSIILSDLRERLSWPDSFPDDQYPSDGGIVITNVHKSKGMEFDIVTLLEPATDAAGNGERDAGADASVSYVGITRAGQQLDTASADQIYKAPWYKDYNGRKRLMGWHNYRVGIEVGLKGDVDPAGFVDSTFLGSAAGVENLQEFLLREAAALAGRKVMLQRDAKDGKIFWAIHLQEADKAGRLIGRTSNQLTTDILSELYNKGFQLPGKIYNLRISDVGSLTSDQDIALEEPLRSSRLWLGVSLFGMGDFKPFKRGKA